MATRQRPRVTLALVFANVAVFAFLAMLPGPRMQQVLLSAGAIPRRIVGGAPNVGPLAPLTIVSSLFLHGGVEHLAGNLWFLWLFGRAVEDAVGSALFLVFYLVVGVV